MSNDVSVELIRSLVAAIEEPSLGSEMGASPAGWESFAVVLVFGEGYRNASGFAYPPGGAIVPVACSWSSIDGAVHSYLGSYYEPGDVLPAALLVQFDRTVGAYEMTFEDTNEDRWAVKPGNFRQMREHLRPRLAD